jgi:uncharacterized protein (TIGR00296 family)
LKKFEGENMLSEDDGKYLLSVAKDAIETYVKENRKIDTPSDCPDYMHEELGVFVTLNKHNNLRGCIGYPEPVYPLIDAVIDSAISAAMRDPRFPSVDESELDSLDYEITVLTKPQIIEVEKPIDYLDNITIGEDGLIVERGFYRGLLLPQVAPEHNMDKEEFLSHTCMKAGLRPDAWLDKNTKVYKFQGQIFK